jgi:hypothetical protein
MLACLAALLLNTASLPPSLANDTSPEPTANTKARAIEVKGLPTGRGDYDKPTRITTEKELAKAIPDKEVRAAILKQADLKKEHLLLFIWSGSGGDRLSLKDENKGEVTFEFTHGLRSDLRPHAHLFAIPAKSKFKVTVKR